MRFLIITHVQHKAHNGKIYAYGPYVREMNLWFKHVDEVIVVAPLRNEAPTPIDEPYAKRVRFLRVPAFSLIGAKEMLKTLVKLPWIKMQIFRGMWAADHLHLRLPGNMGLLGSMMQTVFPHKPKTVKYAGNWDPQAPQPWSYRLQKKIVSSPLLTRNAKVLVYGKWPGQSRNIVPFFTASYSEADKEPVEVRPLDPPLRALFVGSLTEGKRPGLAVEAVGLLHKQGVDIHLDIYGDGPQRPKLEKLIAEKGLGKVVRLHGKQSAETVRRAYKQAHFLIFPSRSEGWPKVVAEAMWWKCLPVTTRVSAVPYMLGEGRRGSLVEPTAEAIAGEISEYLKNPAIYKQKAETAAEWSRRFTLERFEREIAKLL